MKRVFNYLLIFLEDEDKLHVYTFSLLNFFIETKDSKQENTIMCIRAESKNGKPIQVCMGKGKLMEPNYAYI